MQLWLLPISRILHHLQTLLPKHPPDIPRRTNHLMDERIIPVHIDSGGLYFPLAQQSAPTTIHTQHVVPFEGGCARLARGFFGRGAFEAWAVGGVPR